MEDTISLSWLVRQKVGFYYILAVIALVTIFVFIIDIIAPVGMLIWILYLIPLFLTVFLHLKYAPVAMTGVIIFLIAVSLSLSPGEMSAEYALINLTFFVVIFGIVTVFTEGYISNVENLTKSKELEKELRRINRHLGMLLAIIRHGILHRLGIIDGYTDYLRYNPEHHHLDGILEKIESTTSEIQNHIEFAKSNMDLIYLKPQWIDLDTVIPRSQIPSSIILESSVEGISVFAIPIFDKIFFDLLDYSIQHGERVTKIQISYHKEGRNLVVIWEDNGVGIAEANKKNFFGIGWRPQGPRMYFVREYLSATDITIIENGEPGKGARFEIMVPEGMWRKTGKGT